MAITFTGAISQISSTHHYREEETGKKSLKTSALSKVTWFGDLSTTQ